MAVILNPKNPHQYTEADFKKISYAEIFRESQKLAPNILPKKAASDWLAAIKAGASERLPFFVLGTEEIRSDVLAAQNFGTVAVVPATTAQKEIKELFLQTYPDLSSRERKSLLDSHLREGAVINAANWYVFLNDCFIYGAIGANKEFHVGLKSISSDLIWDSKEKRPRALGRELLMLELAGYTPYKTGYGYAFAPPTLRSPGASLIEEFREEIKKVSSIDRLNQFLARAVPL
ncbi:MAG: hypothetical protein JSR39_01430 [Verrucomicrobia bacterium]|nr:hypothetical protein [Verrucomicrobiota bacterium]